MIKYLAIFFMLFLCIINCNAQNQNLSNFLPKDYFIFEKYFGDLNKDGENDCVLIIKDSDEKNIVINRFDERVDRNRRGIIILLKDGNNYKIATKNYDCFTSENEDGGVYFPPELCIDFKRGNLIIHYAHGRYGYWNYTF